MNLKMKMVLDEKSQKQNSDFVVNDIVNNIVKNTIKIKDCIIFDDKGKIKEKDIDFEWVLDIYGDWTGFEVGCNEVFLSYDLLGIEDIISMLKKLKTRLLKKYKERKFCIIVSLENQNIILRFHTYRENEGMWITEDINSYDNPILYDVF
jgi:hypothetical protein